MNSIMSIPALTMSRYVYQVEATNRQMITIIMTVSIAVAWKQGDWQRMQCGGTDQAREHSSPTVGRLVSLRPWVPDINCDN